MSRTHSAMMSGVAAIALMTAGAAYASDEITHYGPETFSVDEFDVDRFVGTIEIIVENRSDIEIVAFGPSERMENFDVETRGDAVEISYDRDDFRWNDWSTWVSWWSGDTFKIENHPTVTVRLPEGTPVDVDSMTGNFTMGDLNGPLSFGGAGAIDATIGTLTSADISIAGAGDIIVGDIDGDIDISISGAGEVHGQSAGTADISLRGASEVSFTDLRGGLELSIAGAGDVDVASVNGDVDISIAGSGDVDIDAGWASAFDVSIAGSGDVRFGGTAIDPDISIHGSGDVYIEVYEGRLSHSGRGDITIGGGS